MYVYLIAVVLPLIHVKQTVAVQHKIHASLVAAVLFLHSVYLIAVVL